MKKRYLSGLLVLVVALAAVVGCKDDVKDDVTENTDPKSIVITGLTDIPSIYWLGVYNSFDVDFNFDSNEYNGIVAGGGTNVNGGGTVVNGSATIELKTQGWNWTTGSSDWTTDWTGTGEYWIVFVADSPYYYLYTNSKTLEEIDLQQGTTKVPKYNITDTISTIPFGKFQALPVEEE
jgi:hypothetical protein